MTVLDSISWKKLDLEFKCQTGINNAKYAHTVLLTVVGFKLCGHFKFYFDMINVRVTFLDAKGPIK